MTQNKNKSVVRCRLQVSLDCRWLLIAGLGWQLFLASVWRGEAVVVNFSFCRSLPGFFKVEGNTTQAFFFSFRDLLSEIS